MRTFYAVLFVLAAMVSRRSLSQVSLSIQTSKTEKPVVGLPFTANETVRTEQHLANGTILKSEAKGHLFRSASGLERFEMAVPGTASQHPQVFTVSYIIDLANHKATLLNSKQLTATVQALPENATVAVTLLPLPQARSGNRPIRPENVTTADLGKKPRGLTTLVGRRVTGTIPAGIVGNNEALVVTTDIWFDPDLRIPVVEKEQNPIYGERTMELTDTKGSEPDAALFAIPDGYTIKNIQIPLMPRVDALGGGTPDDIRLAIGKASTSSSASYKNSVAYALAKKSQNLGEAQSLGEAAVLLEEQKTAEVAEAKDAAEMYRQTGVLSSYWDTLGWVYFLEEKKDKAEKYLHAAWDLRQNPETGLHLGTVLTAESRTDDAVEILRMSLNSAPAGSLRDELEALLKVAGRTDTTPMPAVVTKVLPRSVITGPTGSTGEMEIRMGHGHPAIVAYAENHMPAPPKLLSAVQADMDHWLPDEGPEQILRHATINCPMQTTLPCELQFETIK